MYGPLSVQCAAQIGIQLLNALEIIHEKGYLHCDIKPDNFMVQGLLETAGDVQERNRQVSLTQDANAGTIKLIDFGQV